MSNHLDAEKKAILQFFERQGQAYWKTLEEIANGTRLSHAIVAEVVTSSGDFVRSSYRAKQGEPLYTSRDIFRDKAPLVDKVIGAFKNRID